MHMYIYTHTHAYKYTYRRLFCLIGVTALRPFPMRGTHNSQKPCAHRMVLTIVFFFVFLIFLGSVFYLPLCVCVCMLYLCVWCLCVCARACVYMLGYSDAPSGDRRLSSLFTQQARWSVSSKRAKSQQPGTHFSCFTGTKVQKLTQKTLLVRWHASFQIYHAWVSLSGS